jgi:hypothetical protein
MPVLEKKSQTKQELEVEIKSLEEKSNNQAEQILQMQRTIKELQNKLTLSEKEQEVRRNLLNEKFKSQAINPQNLHRKLKDSGHPPDIQEQILRNAN